MPWVDVDTNSDFFQKGKMKFNNALKKDTSFKETAKRFKEPDASQGVFVMAGERFMVALDYPNDKETFRTFHWIYFGTINLKGKGCI